MGKRRRCSDAGLSGSPRPYSLPPRFWFPLSSPAPARPEGRQGRPLAQTPCPRESVRPRLFEHTQGCPGHRSPAFRPDPRPDPAGTLTLRARSGGPLKSLGAASGRSGRRREPAPRRPPSPPHTCCPGLGRGARRGPTCAAAPGRPPPRSPRRPGTPSYPGGPGGALYSHPGLGFALMRNVINPEKRTERQERKEGPWGEKSERQRGWPRESPRERRPGRGEARPTPM